MVIKTVHQEKMRIREALKKLEIGDHNAVARWKRIYLTEGAKELYIELRGRRSKEHPSKMPAKGEKDLLAEVYRLRVENAYLKTVGI